MYWVYIIKSALVNKYYVGHTANIESRIFHHRAGREKYTKIASDWQVVFSKEFKTRKEAKEVENFIKKQKSKIFIEKIIAGKVNLNINIIPG
ncbi:MAG: GIY-YIG nuclease family protein [Nitrospirae bacterium]|nr:GIY-YIG nuclease family protein [Nitrospirota bacterium]